MYGTEIKLLSTKKDPLLLNYIFEQVSHQYELPPLMLILAHAHGHGDPWMSGQYRVSYIAPLSYDSHDEYLIRYKPGHDTAEECSIHLEVKNGSDEIRSLIFLFPYLCAKNTFSRILAVIKEVSHRRHDTHPEFLCYGLKETDNTMAFISETRMSMLVYNGAKKRYMHKTLEEVGIAAFQ